MKYSKKEVNYQDPAQGMNHCGLCKHFQPESDETGTCEVVSGSISEDAWCRMFSKKAKVSAEDKAEDRAEGQY